MSASSVESAGGRPRALRWVDMVVSITVKKRKKTSDSRALTAN